jgi:hypothetical protein
MAPRRKLSQGSLAPADTSRGTMVLEAVARAPEVQRAKRTWAVVNFMMVNGFMELEV